MKEECQLALYVFFFSSLPDPIGGQHEMVIVDPHDWRGIPVLLLVILQQLQGVDGFCREFLVDFDVRPPVVGDKGCPVRHGVEQRPECAVAAAIVVTVE